ncbi:hypothetical protein GCM10009676_13220 [Prauserella halophila]|uniref:DUF6895 domain-containing protein n=1 Tax=Prauserella halophila TaxID=185641 RepID=A0ABN1W1S5_9PSEU
MDEDRLALSALEWLHAQRRWFDPCYWEEYLPARRFRPGPLLELIVLLRCVSRGPYAQYARALTESGFALAESVCRWKSFRQGLQRWDETFPYFAYFTAVLEAAGRDAGPALDAVETALALGCGDVSAADRPALTRLELAYVTDLGGFSTVPVEWSDAVELYRTSIAGTRDNTLFMRDDEAYALTHVLFYLSDFGSRALPLPAPVEADRVRDQVSVLLGSCLARDDLDLAGEFLLCAETLGSADDPLVAHGWHRLAAAQHDDGAVPSPLYNPHTAAMLEGAKRSAYLFGTCFHTTMVAIMASSERRRHAR